MAYLPTVPIDDLDPEQLAALQQLATQTGRSVEELITNAIDNFVLISRNAQN